MSAYRVMAAMCFAGPDYAPTDFRVARRRPLGNRLKSEFVIETLNLFSGIKKRRMVRNKGFMNPAGYFLQDDKLFAINNFLDYYMRPANCLLSPKPYTHERSHISPNCS